MGWGIAQRGKGSIVFIPESRCLVCLEHRVQGKQQERKMRLHKEVRTRSVKGLIRAFNSQATGNH